MCLCSKRVIVSRRERRWSVWGGKGEEEKTNRQVLCKSCSYFSMASQESRERWNRIVECMALVSPNIGRLPLLLNDPPGSFCFCFFFCFSLNIPLSFCYWHASLFDLTHGLFLSLFLCTVHTPTEFRVLIIYTYIRTHVRSLFLFSFSLPLASLSRNYSRVSSKVCDGKGYI